MDQRPEILLGYRAAFWLAVPAVLLFLVAGSVAWAVNDPGLYRNGFQRYDTSARSGIAETDLLTIGAELRRYFNTGAEPLSVRSRIHGVQQDVFGPREVAHMHDVKKLVRGTYWVALGSFLWIAAVVIAGLALRGGERLGNTARLACWGGALTVVAVVGVGLAAVAGFQQLFLLFHRLSFANDLWILDPRTDNLLILFPLGFWFDATLRVALTSILGGLLLFSVGIAALGYRQWQRRRRTQPPASPHDAGEHVG